MFFFMLVTALSVCLSSCSKDDEDTFDYPMSQLYGKWKTRYPYTKFGMSITFYENGTFYGSGYLGNGSGTYKTNGKNQIITYVSGKEYATYTVNSISSGEADLTLSMGSESLRMHINVP